MLVLLQGQCDHGLDLSALALPGKVSKVMSSVEANPEQKRNLKHCNTIALHGGFPDQHGATSRWQHSRDSKNLPRSL